MSSIWGSFLYLVRVTIRILFTEYFPYYVCRSKKHPYLNGAYTLRKKGSK